MEPDHFALLGVMPAFWPDEAAIRKAYLEQQRLSHPDLLQKSGGDPQAIEQHAAAINKAYTVLKDFELRVKFMLQINGSLNDDEKYPLPQEFLMEMMDLNDLMLEAGSGEDAKNIADQSLKQYEDAVLGALSGKTREYDAQASDALLAEIKDLYFRRRYLKRLRMNLQNAGAQP